MMPCSIGPRMTTLCSGSSKKPIDINLKPPVSIGWMRSPRAMGRPLAPTRCGIDGP